MAAPIYEGPQIDFNATERFRGTRYVFDEAGRLIVRLSPKCGVFVISDAQDMIVEADPDVAEDLVGRWERFGGCPVVKRRDGQSA